MNHWGCPRNSSLVYRGKGGQPTRACAISSRIALAHSGSLSTATTCRPSSRNLPIQRTSFVPPHLGVRLAAISQMLRPHWGSPESHKPCIPHECIKKILMLLLFLVVLD